MRILELQLQTHKLDALKKFYRDRLELPVIAEKKRYFIVQAGTSRIKFSKAEEREEPFYHFAFNIPENQLAEAKRWLAARVPLISQDGRDEFHFENWNADAIYFYDPAGNIVEFIARHNLKNASKQPFSSNSILCVSEIGQAVENVRLFSQHIRQELKLKLWDGDEQGYAALGDEEGLFIIVPVERPWFPAGKPAEDFPVFVNLG